MSKRECTEAEHKLIEACIELEAAPTNPARLRYRTAYRAVLAERQPKDATEVFVDEVRAILCRCHPDGPPQQSYCASEVAVKDVFARLAKLDAARKDKP